LASADRQEDELEEAKGCVSRRIAATSFAMRQTSSVGRATGPVAAVGALESPGVSMVSKQIQHFNSVRLVGLTSLRNRMAGA